MKLGLWGARGDNRGLAHQTLGFARWLKPDRIMCIDMTADDLSPYPCDFEPFAPHTPRLSGRRHSSMTQDEARSWLRGLDVVIGAESFYWDEFPTWAREEGVRTVLQVNPEFVGWWYKGVNDPKPDVLIAPTTWRLDRMPGVLHLPFPVDRNLFPFRKRTEAGRFVHVAGHKAMGDRAGTRIVMTALGRTRPLDVIIRSQSKLDFLSPSMKRATIEEGNIPDNRNLYQDADVIIHPRRYGGQSLVANEALSSGCPVIMLDREPEKNWGGVVTVPCRSRGQMRTKCGLIQVCDASGHHLARKMDELAGSPELVERLSEEANSYAETISWERLLPVYQDFFNTVAEGKEPALCLS